MDHKDIESTEPVIEKNKISLNEIGIINPDEITTVVSKIEKLQFELSEIKKTAIELQYLELFNHVPVGCFTIDKTCHFTDINAHAATIFGSTISSLLNNSIFQFFISDNHHIYHNFINQINSNVLTETFESQITRGDNSTIWVKIYSGLIQEASRSFYIIDISDIKNFKKYDCSDLEYKTKQLNILSDVSPSGIWRTDHVGVMIYISPRLTEITGIKHEGTIGKVWWDGIHPDDKDRVVNDWTLAVEANAEFQSEFRYLKPYDETVWVLCNAKPMKGNVGECISWIGTITDITLRKQNDEINIAKNELDTARARYFDPCELEPVDYWTLSEKGLILEKKRLIMEFNHNTSVMLDVPRSELSGKLITNYIFVKDLNIYFSSRQKLYDTQEPQTCELRMQKSDGTLFWTSLELTATLNDTGEFLCRIIISDISERKKAEEELRDANWRMESIIEGTNAGTWEWNIQTGEVIINEIWANTIGYSLKELVPFNIKKLEKLFHPDDLVESAELLERHFAGELPYYNYECRLKHKDGHWVWIHNRGRLITRTNDDKPLIISGIHIDINIRKINENALRDSENRFRNMFEKHSAAMLLIESESGQIVDANGSAANFYGYNQSTMCSMNISSINMMPENEIFEMRKKAMFEKQNLFEFPHRLSNGEIRQVEVDSSPIEYHGKSILFSIIHDITERKQYEKALLVQHDLSLLMGASNNINEALELILDAAMQLDSIDCGGIYLVNQDKELDLIAQRGLSKQFLADNSHYSVDSPQSVIVNAGVAIYSTYENIMLESGKSNNNEGLLALAIIPVVHNGELLAVLNLSSHTHNVIPLNTRNTIETIASQMGSILMRLQMHVELLDSQQNLQALFDTVDDLLFVLDENGNIVKANNIVYESLGYVIDELAGLNIIAIHPLERREEAGVIVADMLSGKRDSCPVPLQAKDGALIPVETRVTKGVWGGKPALFGISRDMTERNIAKNAMEKQNLRLESVIDGTHIGTWEWNVQTGETEFNELWAQMFGYTLDELKPISIKTWEKLVHPDDLNISNELIQQHFDNKLPYYEFDCRMKHKDGHWVWINDHGRVMTRTADGKPLMMFGTHTDIYKHKKIEEDVKKAMRDIRTLKGIVPICANCKKIRDDHGFWTQVEVYLRDHTEAEFSHGICPDCMVVLYPDIDISDDCKC